MPAPYVDLGAGFSASSAVGGGNVFNSAPLFGDNSGTGGSSTGDDGASALASASGLGGDAGGSLAALPTTSQLEKYLPYILIGLGGLVVVWLVTRLFGK
jgi:hypothetical protein